MPRPKLIRPGTYIKRTKVYLLFNYYATHHRSFGRGYTNYVDASIPAVSHHGDIALIALAAEDTSAVGGKHLN